MLEIIFTFSRYGQNIINEKKIKTLNITKFRINYKLQLHAELLLYSRQSNFSLVSCKRNNLPHYVSYNLDRSRQVRKTTIPKVNSDNPQNYLINILKLILINIF